MKGVSSVSLGDRRSAAALSVLRIVAAFLFMAHGMSKLLGFPGQQPPQFELLSLIGLAGGLELIGGALLLIGLFTRPVAFVLSGEMAFAYFIAHAPHGFWPLVNRGELAVLYCFVFLFLAVAGAGPWSVDQWRHNRVGVADESPRGRSARRARELPPRAFWRPEDESNVRPAP